jgi:transcription antitermination factor NusG
MQGKGRSLGISSSQLVASADFSPLVHTDRTSQHVRTADTDIGTPAWYAIWTRSHCEQLVSDQLRAKGLAVFLPKASVWSIRRGARRRNEVPLFPGYLFVHHAIDKSSYVEIIKARGVVRVLGARWDRLETVGDDVIAAVRQVTQSGAPVQSHPRLRAGERVRVTRGPLQGLQGIFVRERSTKGLFVLNVDLLRRSVAVEVDSALVEVL